MRIHFLYKALDSQEQQVARLWDRLYQPFTMAGLGSQPDLAHTICKYRAYLSCPETDLFYGNYEVVLDPYCVDSMNAAAALTPASMSQQIFSASHQGDPTAFLLWHATPGIAEDRDPGHVSTLSVTTPVGWEDCPASGTTGHLQTTATYPMAPHLWRTGILPTFTLPWPYMCRAPPTSTLLLLEMQTLHCWDPTERETWGLKPYAVAR